MRRIIILLATLVCIAVAQEATTNTVPPNRIQPIIAPGVDLVVGVKNPETTPVSTPRPIPPNRKRPVMDPSKGVVVGLSAQHLLPSTGTNLGGLVNKHESRLRDHGYAQDFQSPLSHDTKPLKPVISKADVIMAVVDGMGAIADLLADNLANDINDVVDGRPPTAPVGDLKTNMTDPESNKGSSIIHNIDPKFQSGIEVEPEFESDANADLAARTELGDETKGNKVMEKQLAVQELIETQATSYPHHPPG
jgi:hypothetical protein